MPTKWTKILDKGTSNQIVARTTVQIIDLLAPYGLPENERHAIMSIFASLMRRLLRMQEVQNMLRKEYAAIRAQVRSAGLKQLGEGSYEIPQMMGLDAKAEDFLQATKLALADCGSLFGPLFGRKFDHRFDRAIAWFAQKIGQSHELVTQLEKHHVWIKQALDRRNALEHPKEAPGGRLHIRNVDVDIVGPKLMGTDPCWYLSGDQPTSIIRDTRILVENTLRLAEEILISSLEYRFPQVPVIVKEIPPRSRDSKCPVRFRLVPRGRILGA